MNLPRLTHCNYYIYNPVHARTNPDTSSAPQSRLAELLFSKYSRRRLPPSQPRTAAKPSPGSATERALDRPRGGTTFSSHPPFPSNKSAV